jgi:YidC/Oxa1 family membrane protein insertase
MSRECGAPVPAQPTSARQAQTTFKHSDAPMTREVVAYLGLKNYDDLEQADAAAGFSTGFNKVVDLGWFAFIGRPLLWLLQTFHEGVGNWGIASIVRRSSSRLPHRGCGARP